MNSEAATIESSTSRMRQRTAAYFDLGKPRVVAMVLVTALAGYYLGAGNALNLAVALNLLAGTAIAAAGTLALNQYLERDLDLLMERTRRRPLPSGRLLPAEALIFGLVATIGGTLYLGFAVAWLSAAVIVSIGVLYLLAYTPLKRISWICNIVGAVPGALPPVIGWAAAGRGLGAEPFVLFAIMYLWQLPHSLAIARLYRRDYANAGIRLYPPDNPHGGNIANTIVAVDCLVLIAASLSPTLIGFAGRIYLAVALVLGIAMLLCGFRFFSLSERSAPARRVMMATLIYLPLILLALVLDKV